MEIGLDKSSNEPQRFDKSGETNSESHIIHHVFKSILSRWWVFVIIGLVGGAAGFYYASNKKPVYESYLSFALDEGGSEGGMSGALGLAAQFGLSLGGAKDVFTGDNILEIMLSRRVIEKVLLDVDTFQNKPATLIQFYLENEEQADRASNTKTASYFRPGAFKDGLNYAADSILYATFLEFKQNYISVRRPNKRLNIYELSVNSHFEKFSKVFTDKLINETNRFYTEISSKKARETLEILENRVPDVKGKLDAAISRKAAIQDANLNTAFSSAQVPMIKEQSNAQVYGTAYAEMFKNLEMARFQYLKSIPLMQVIDAADYPMKKVGQGKLKTAIICAVISSFIFFLFFILATIFNYGKKTNTLITPQ
ncbi:MAG: hypothetical protein Q7T76_14280 [Ferruginibacter sp.]|nr:hypothetical protein [Ferruginibacter sp.]